MTAALLIKSASRVIRRREHGVHAQARPRLMKFAAAVATRRMQLGLSRTELATRTGISYWQLSHIENAENWPTLPVYLALCRELKCGRVPLV